MPGKITPCLWMSDIVAAGEYYARIFNSPEAPRIARMPDGNPITVHVDILGTTFMLLGQSPDFTFNESVSFMIDCKDQAEVDYYWTHFVGDGGAESQCGWCKDRFGLSWQVVPQQIFATVHGPDPEGAQRAMQAMFKMRKLIVADLEAAYAGT